MVHGVIATLGWSRFEAILDATIKQTDPDGAQAAEQDAATRRFVAVGRANDHHIRTLIARGTSLDILSFMAAVNRIADLLGAEGDADSIDIRRSKAIGVLARPAHALELLARHQSEDSAEAANRNGDPDPEGDGYLSSPPTRHVVGRVTAVVAPRGSGSTCISPTPPCAARTRGPCVESRASARSLRIPSGTGWAGLMRPSPSSPGAARSATRRRLRGPARNP